MSLTMDLTTLPSDTSPASVAAHIASIENSVNEQLMDIEKVKTVNSHLQKKIENIGEQIVEANKVIQDKVIAKQKIEEEIVQAQRVAKQLKSTAGEFVSCNSHDGDDNEARLTSEIQAEKVKQNDELQEKSNHSISQAKNLIVCLEIHHHFT
jgi:hypothetical protein